jgi:hypothetical protein
MLLIPDLSEKENSFVPVSEAAAQGKRSTAVHFPKQLITF